MSNQITLGIIGHVDHGKTALVRALTGIETDRLREEKERGLSIVLGFSYLETPNGTLDLIDVPGHEDFVRAMISGATAVDGVVLVVAANEGVMPQTKEHFDIARLLGLKRGIIVVSKVDLVSEARRGEAEAEIRKFVAGTFLETAPLFNVSCVTGEGIEDLQAELARIAGTAIERPGGRSFYQPLDRVFTMRGFGLVVTGTLRGGLLRTGDAVEIMPAGKHATVRTLQNHGRIVTEALPGARVAVNLRGVKREEVERGDVLATPGLITPTRRIDAELHLLEDASEGLGNAATVRLLTGTMEAIAKIRLLGQARLEPGGTGFVQLRCDRDIATHVGEKFVIRSYSPMRTIGGGRILDTQPGRHRRFDATVTGRLSAVAGGDPVAILAQALDEAGERGVDAAPMAERLGLGEAEVVKMADSLDAVRTSSGKLVSKRSMTELADRIVRCLESFHVSRPREIGLSLGALMTQLEPEPPEDIYRVAINELTRLERIRQSNGFLQAAGFDVLAGLSPGDRATAEAIGETYLAAGIVTPALEQIVGTDKSKREIGKLLIETGQLVRLRTRDRSVQIVVHAATLDDVERRIRARYPSPKKFTLANVRDVLESTRRYVVPLMEHFDATGRTVRIGDLRYLRED